MNIIIVDIPSLEVHHMRSLPVKQAHIEVDGPAVLVILVIVFLMLRLDLGIRSVHHLLA